MPSFFGFHWIVVLEVVICFFHMRNCSINVWLNFIWEDIFGFFEEIASLTIMVSLDFENSFAKILVEQTYFFFGLEIQAFVLLESLFVLAQTKITIGFELVEERLKEVVKCIFQLLQLVKHLYGVLKFTLHKQDSRLVEQTEVLQEVCVHIQMFASRKCIICLVVVTLLHLQLDQLV